MEIIIKSIGLILGLVILIFNKELAEKSAESAYIFSKTPKNKLILHYRIGGYLAGIAATIFSVLALLCII